MNALIPLADGTPCIRPVASIENSDESVSCSPRGQRKVIVLMTIAIVLILLWALGLLTSYTMSGLIHVLLVVAIVVILIRVIQGRRVL